MKVLALIYGDEQRWASFDEKDRETVYAKYRAFGETAGDKVIGGAELAPTRTATTVRVRDGETIVSDGPFTETKEQLGGFYVFECNDLGEAEALAAQIPGAATGTIELRVAHEEEAA
jgi:hypothetical protein